MGNSRNLANLLGTGSTIATAKIADDAITAAKIATDAVVADGLSSSAIATGDLPVSAITKIDTLVGQSPGSQTGTNSTDFTSAFTVTYTPKVWGNKCILISSLNMWGDVDNDGQTTVQGQVRMQTSTDGGTTFSNAFTSGTSVFQRGGQSRFSVKTIHYEMTLPASGTDLRIRWQSRKTQSDRSFNFGGQLGSQVTVIEVQE